MTIVLNNWQKCKVSFKSRKKSTNAQNSFIVTNGFELLCQTFRADADDCFIFLGGWVKSLFALILQNNDIDGLARKLALKLFDGQSLWC